MIITFATPTIGQRNITTHPVKSLPETKTWLFRWQATLQGACLNAGGDHD